MSALWLRSRFLNWARTFSNCHFCDTSFHPEATTKISLPWASTAVRSSVILSVWTIPIIQHAICRSGYWKIQTWKQKSSIFVPLCHTKLLPLVHSCSQACSEEIACLCGSFPVASQQVIPSSQDRHPRAVQSYWCWCSVRQLKQSYKAHFIHQGLCQQLLVCSTPPITVSRERYPPAALHPAFSGRAEQSAMWHVQGHPEWAQSLE